MSALSEEEARQACSEPDEATKNFKLHHAMYRVKDPKVSLDFYTRALGLRLLFQMDSEEGKFTLFFLGYENEEDIPKDKDERRRWTFTRKFVIELVHNWGTEDKPDFKYHNGNSEPQGFGHIAIVVPDTQVATERLEKLNVKFIKKPNEGRMKGIVFVADPDGYWIELIDPKCVA